MTERTGDAHAFLVDAAWLQRHLDRPGLKVIDVRPPLEQFQSGYAWGHIPGAIHLNMQQLFTVVDGIPGKLAPQALGEAILGQLGLSPDEHVVVYDDSGGPLAALLAWLLDHWGQARVSLLDGGWQAWLEEGGAVTAVAPSVAPVTYCARPDEGKLATLEWIAARLDHPDMILVDVRTPLEFQRGHLPGAVNLPWEENVSPGLVQRYRDQAFLRQRFERAGITPDREVVVYCETGARSAHTYWALRLAGYSRVRNYEGSWAEWSRLQHHRGRDQTR